MLNVSTDMRIKRSFKTIVIFVVFFFVIKAYNYITKPKSKLSVKNSIVLQADPFDDKEDPSFDKFQRANEILHGNDLEKYLIKDDKISNDNEYGDVENDVVIEENIEHDNQHKDKNSDIKSLHHEDDNNIIHHHHLKEPLKADSVKEYNQIKLREEYDREIKNRDKDSKDFKSGKKQANPNEAVKNPNKANIKKKNEARNVNHGEKILENEEDTEEKMVGKLVNQIERHENELNNDVVMARPDLLVHTFDLNNESLVINETNKEKLVNKKFDNILDKKDSNGDKHLAHIEHIEMKKDVDVNKHDKVHKDEKVDKKDTMVENKGEQLVNQIERHDSDLNNDIVMARPDLLVHTFDMNNESLVIDETNKEKLVNKKFNKMLNKTHSSKNDVDSQIKAPSMNKVKNKKKLKDQLMKKKKQMKLKGDGEKVVKKKDTKTKNSKMKHVASREEENRKRKKEAVRDHKHQFGIIESWFL